LKKKVLLVEDDPDDCFVDLLEDFEDCRIVPAKTVADALRKLYQEKFHAIIMDIIIPAGERYEDFFQLSSDTRGCPGYELARIIREGYFGKIPTVIFSGLVGSFHIRGRIARLENDHIFAVMKPEVERVISILSEIN
jgi:CheY-like chemotaxis protein